MRSLHLLHVALSQSLDAHPPPRGRGTQHVVHSTGFSGVTALRRIAASHGAHTTMSGLKLMKTDASSPPGKRVGCSLRSPLNHPIPISPP